MTKKRDPSKFAVYRLTQNHSVFVGNFNSETAAAHAAGCLQAPAPPDIAYKVDPPYGPLAPAKRKQWLWPTMKKIFALSSGRQQQVLKRDK